MSEEIILCSRTVADESDIQGDKLLFVSYSPVKTVFVESDSVFDPYNDMSSGHVFILYFKSRLNIIPWLI